ncbi:HAMP domain-containing histidine kinase [Pedobacter frigidisoli]|uniref:histidine kinase n=1 Tax=Pedobacter frigidisoli TaxID=2530455 RepID=A0A4R0NKH5_9SPHI|nr:HAMP domain-containing sensor histidine kinase [Pedobacter frigidisoli]TCD00669.1 HAMP domain-containing histidine kinase [Pedobacter frigidisoli]
MMAFLCAISFESEAQIQEIRKIQKNLPFVKNEKAKIDAWNTLASLFTQNKRDSVLYYADLAEKHATAINYVAGIAKASNYKGEYYMTLNNYLSAKYYNKALELSKKAKDTSIICESMNNIGASLYIDQNQKLAMKYLYDADDLAKKMQKDSIRSLLLLNMAGVDVSLTAEKRDSISSLALSIAKKYKDEIKILQYADVHARTLYNPFSGLVTFLKANIAKADSMGNTTMKIHFLRRLAEAYIINKDGTNGVKYYEEAIQLCRENSYQVMTAHILGELFKYYRSQGNMERSGYFADQMVQEYQKLSDVAKKSGFNYVDYVMSPNNLKVEQERAETQKRIIIVFSILIALTLLLLFFVYRSYRIKKNYAKVQEELHEKSKEREADLADREKFYNTIISVMAHDLRSPFSSIMMASDLYTMGGDTLSEEEKNQIMVKMKDISLMSIQFMEGLLAWVKSRMDGYVYQAKSYNLNQLVLEANAFCLNEQENKNIKLELKSSANDQIQGDKNMLLFVFRNILSNATKYSGMSKVITVNLIEKQGSLLLSFTDYGIGMTDDGLKNLFSYQENADSKTGKVKGAGIALTICKEMIGKMNGKIWAESIRMEGSTFYISLPHQ